MSDAATTPLLGRVAELGVLTARLAAQSGVVLLGGDAGVGKTRLLVELAQTARAQGWRVLVGHCLDVADSLLPYLPFTEMVGRFADEDPEAAAWVLKRHPALASLAPGRRLHGGPRQEDATLADAVGALDRAAVLDAVHGALESLAERGPVLVVLEDLHWADQSTRDLLSYLCARPFRGPVVVVGSFRSEDLHRRHPLRPALAQWTRLPGVHRLELGPLPDADVRRLIRACAGHGAAEGARLPEREVARIAARVEGNAFFAEELAAAWRSPEQQSVEPSVPDSLADLLLVRLDSLSDTARAVVRAASCSGRRVSHGLLARVVGLSAEHLDQALREAVEQHVLVPAGGDAYAFRHALLAEAVYDDLLPGERTRLHAAYVAALEEGDIPATPAEIATHARAAGDVATALRAGVDAGSEAMAVGGPDEAARHFESALGLATRPGSQVDVDLVDLVRRTAEAIIASGHAARAATLLRDQLDRPPRAWADDERATLLVLWAGAALLNELTVDPSVATAEALALIGEEPSWLRAAALSLHGRCLAVRGDDEASVRHASEALVMAQRLDLADVAAEAATTLALVDDRAGDGETAVKALDAVVEAAERAGDVVALLRSLYNRGYVQLEWGLLAEAQASFAAAMRVAVDRGQPWAPYGFDARLMVALCAYLRGRWDEVLVVADVSGESPPADPEALLATLRMLVAAGRGDVAALQAYPLIRGSWEREPIGAINCAAAAMDLHGRAGDLDAVRRVHDEVVATIGRIWVPLFVARLRLAALELGWLAGAARGASRAERSALVTRGRSLGDVVEAVVSRVERQGRQLGPEGQAWVARARAELCRLRWLAGEEAPPDLGEQWDDVTARFATYGHRYEEARSRLRAIEARVAAGQSVSDDADLVRRAADDLGSPALRADLDAMIGGSPGSTSPRPARSPSGAPASAPDLTSREREVLELVAAGLTNGEIGRRLFISTKTVSVHVSNILAKLGAGSRTEAAAVARQRGLLG